MSTAATKSAADKDTVQQPGPTQQLNRSCESCRNLKVRCLPDPASPNQCQRCAKANRACVFVAPQRRRPRKRTDSRVAQLEREMRQMRSLLKDRLRVNESSPESSESEVEDAHEPESELNSKDTLLPIQYPSSDISGSSGQPDSALRLPTPSSAPPAFKNGAGSSIMFNPMPCENPPDIPPEDDVISRGVISLDCADSLLSLFLTELALYAPVIILPPNITASQMRLSKPVLFLSVIAAAAMSVDANLAALLNRELVRLYAEQFFINGKKSLELIQALLLMIIFYYPPNSPLELQFYQYAHIAATMALEIGIASKPRVGNNHDPISNKSALYNDRTAEEARAILSCYHFASQVAMKTRRPNLLFFNDWVSECVAYLGSSPNVIDLQMASWFELQRIVDEALASFGLDDTSASTVLTESRIQVILRLFDNRMQSWYKNLPSDMLSVPVNFEYQYTKLAIYELAIGEGYRDPSAVKQKYYTLPVPEENTPSSNLPLSAARIDTTIKWMNASHELLDIFLGCDTDLLRKMPNLIYTRTCIAVMSLLKIYFSVRSGALGEVITPQAVKVESYLNAMAERLTEASDGEKYRVPSRWRYVIAVKARSWYEQLEQQAIQKHTDTSPQATASSMAPENTVQVQNLAGLTPTHPPQPTMPLGMEADVCTVPFESMSRGYGAPIAMAPVWPPSHGGHHSFLEVDHFQGYQQPVLAPHFTYVSQSKVLLSQGPRSDSAPPKADMEVDGWASGHSIYGMPFFPGN